MDPTSLEPIELKAVSHEPRVGLYDRAGKRGLGADTRLLTQIVSGLLVSHTIPNPAHHC